MVGKLVKKNNLNIRLRAISSRDFYLQAALDDLQQVSLSQVLEISRQCFLLTTKCAEKSRWVPLVLKVPKFISRHAASHTSRMLSYQRLGFFLRGIINIRGLISQNVGTVPELSNLNFPFGTSVETDFLVSALIQPFTFPSLKFEYSFLVLEMPRRESYLFLSFFSESETISC